MTTTRAAERADLFGRVLALEPEAFAVLHRPERAPGVLEVLTGDITTPDTLADLPVPGADEGGTGHQVLALVPYRQIAERGFACTDDETPLTAMRITGQDTVPLGEALTRLPEEPIQLVDGHFDTDDAAYAAIVQKIIDEEIGTGEGANFVIRRSFVADITDYTPRAAFVLFRRLLAQETGAYWTFLVHTGTRTLIGATPERHVSLHRGTAVMNPISGTYRYPESGPTLPGVMEFLADRKEADELYMVVDEELKMMARICDRGGRVTGPHLKEMARLAHTEYFIEGHSTRDPRTILRETLFAPTVTGSPLESACRVIDRYEPDGRGYYSGIIALIGRDEEGGHALDSSILIRTADIDTRGRLRIGVGATLVRHSDPESEVAETAAKAAGLLAALRTESPTGFARHPDVLRALGSRNTTIADYWLDGASRTVPATRATASLTGIEGKRILVVDAEDTFTAMMDHQLRSMGLTVTVRRFDEPYRFADHDLVLMGPGPGDPREEDHPRIGHMRGAIGQLLKERRPFLAVCLSHQILSLRLGLELRRRPTPNQGVQKRIDLFGTPQRVGFYNTFAANSPEDTFRAPGVGTVETCRDPGTGEVHALRGPHFASMQFHAESILTENGPHIIGSLLRGLI